MNYKSVRNSVCRTHGDLKLNLPLFAESGTQEAEINHTEKVASVVWGMENIGFWIFLITTCLLSGRLLGSSSHLLNSHNSVLISPKETADSQGYLSIMLINTSRNKSKTKFKVEIRL